MVCTARHRPGPAGRGRRVRAAGERGDGRAPNAKIVVLGYVRLVVPNGNCLNQTKRTTVNNGADELTPSSRVGFRRPARTSSTSTIAQFTEHGACGSSPWLHTLSLTEGVQAANLNGNQLGYLPLLNAVTG
jgi:hypothetical protein